MLGTTLTPDGAESRSWPQDINQPKNLETQDIRPIYEKLKTWLATYPAPEFIGHRWQFSPAAFELAMFDLRATGLTNFVLEEIVSAQGCQEFAVRLRLSAGIEISPKECSKRRSELCRRIEDESAAVTGHCLRLENELAITRAELAETKALLARLDA